MNFLSYVAFIHGVLLQQQKVTHTSCLKQNKKPTWEMEKKGVMVVCLLVGGELLLMFMEGSFVVFCFRSKDGTQEPLTFQASTRPLSYTSPAQGKRTWEYNEKDLTETWWLCSVGRASSNSLLGWVSREEAGDRSVSLPVLAPNSSILLSWGCQP